MKKTAILVTGGAGYIGSHFCKRLAKEGFLPVTYDNLSTGHAYAVKWGPLIQASLSDRAQLRGAFETYRPQAVVHFAASSIVAESMQDPGKYYRNNLSCSLSLLEAMRESDVRHIVFSSTCATYGIPQFNPLTESHPQNPISPYGRSKLMLEQILADFRQIHDFRSVVLRYFNAAGADLETEIGENHTPETHLIPNAIQTALGKRGEVVVYGTDFPTRDGSAIRDYVHVQDLAEAHILALKWMLQENKSATVNLGTGMGHSVLEIIEAIEKYSARPISVKIVPRREGEPSILVADSRLAGELFHWKPKYSDLPTLIESAWKWHRLLIDNALLLRTTIERIGTIHTT